MCASWLDPMCGRSALLLIRVSRSCAAHNATRDVARHVRIVCGVRRATSSWPGECCLSAGILSNFRVRTGAAGNFSGVGD